MCAGKGLGRSDGHYLARLYSAMLEKPEHEDEYKIRQMISALDMLTACERHVLECRFRFAKTLEYIADEIGCTREWVRQIEHRALSKMRRAEQVRDMNLSQVVRDRDEHKQRVIEQEAVIKELRRLIACFTNSLVARDDILISDDTKLNQDVSMMGLSARSYNCLWRAGLKTVRDVYELPSRRELCSIRNLGELSRNEVIFKMRDLGFTDWAEKMNAIGR